MDGRVSREAGIEEGAVRSHAQHALRVCRANRTRIWPAASQATTCAVVHRSKILQTRCLTAQGSEEPWRSAMALRSQTTAALPEDGGFCCRAEGEPK